MKRNLLCYGLALIGAVGMAPTAGAGTPIYSNDFATQADFNSMTTVDAGGTNGDYAGFWRYNSYGSKYAYINTQSNATEPHNDYLVTPAIALTANHQYVVKFRMIGYDYTKLYDYSVDILVGKATDEAPSSAESFADYQNLKTVATTVQGGSSLPNMDLSEVTFVPEESGDYRFAIWANAGGVCIDDLSIEDNGSANGPNAIAGVALSYVDDTVSLSWDAPTSCMNGSTDMNLTYEVVRVLDGESTIVAAAQTATEFTETLVANGIQSLHYEVTPINYEARGAATASKQIKIGSLLLPVAESFAGGVLGNAWEIENVSGASYNWTVVAECSTTPKCTPQDEDGGLIFYNSYSASSGYGSRLFSQPIKVTDNPVVQFYLYRYTNSRYSDKVKVQVSVDGGEWIDVPDGEFTVEGSDIETGWELEYVNIAAAVKDGSTYRVALTTVSAAGYATSIDNILIYNKEKFVGIDTPKPVTDLALSYADNTASLSWVAPTKGVNDVTDLHLTYEVVRIVNGVETIVAEAQEATEFSEEYVPDSFEALSYRVTPINEGTARGESTTSNVVKIGTYTLPIAESFAGGAVGDGWTATIVSGYYNWVADSASNRTPTPSPQDEDGGLLYYQSYNASSGNSARLESAPIKASAYPAIDFYLYQYSSTPKDYVKVQVSKDGGAWEDVEDGSFYVETAPEGWTLKTVALAAAVRGSSTYRVGLTVVSGNGFNAVIDNIRVYETEPYQGIDTPLPVTDVVASNSGSQVTVNWTAPKKGVNGVLELNLTYEVVRIVNGEETVVAEAQEGTQFTEEYSTEDFVQICYRVTPINEGQERGESTTSNYIKMGVMSLPFADSFAGGELSAKWDAEILSGTYCWTAAARSNNVPYATPQDEDGGLAFYQSYSARSGQDSRLYTAPISAASSTNPVLSFYMYHYSSSDALKIQVSKDGGEWEDVEGARFALSDAASDQWVEHQVYLASAIEGATTYRVGITSISAYGKNTSIDNVKIYNVEMYNLQAVSAAGPTNVVAGNGADYVFTVLNKGGKTVAADDYSLEITVNGVAADMESVEIGAGKSAQFTLHLDYDATQVGSDVEIAGKVVYAADENADDNAFETITTAVSALDQPTVNNLDGNFDGECVNLSWTSPIDLSEYQPISISESFEDLESDTQWPYNGFTVADGNTTAHAPTSGYFGFTEPTFTLYVASTSSSWSSPNSPQDGSKMLGVTCASGVQQDDWLISPELNCHEAATMTLSFWMQTKSGQYTGTGCDVVYSTTDSSLASFTNIAKTIPNNTATNGQWVNVVVSGIPATAKYIAIHFNDTYEVSYSTYSMTLIDNVSITDQVSEVIGYNVYESSLGRVNDEMLPADAISFSYEVPTDQSAAMDDEDEADVDQILRAKRKAETDTYYHFYVSTVYDGGEAALSNVADVKITTGVEDIAIDADDSNVEYFNLQGVKIQGQPAPGLYIRRQGKNATKVIIR